MRKPGSRFQHSAHGQMAKGVAERPGILVRFLPMGISPVFPVSLQLLMLASGSTLPYCSPVQLLHFSLDCLLPLKSVTHEFPHLSVWIPSTEFHDSPHKFVHVFLKLGCDDIQLYLKLQEKWVLTLWCFFLGGVGNIFLIKRNIKYVWILNMKYTTFQRNV